MKDKKICFRCKVEKPLSDFNFNKTNKDGRSYECRTCAGEYRRAIRLKYKSNPVELPKQTKIRCSKCKVKKTIKNFFVDKGRPTGRRSCCKLCDTKYQKKWEEKQKDLYSQREIPKTKICSKCKEEKPSSSFNRRKTRKSGVVSECKECCSQRRKNLCKNDKKYRKKNSERSKIYSATHKKEISIYNAAYGKRNKSKRAKRVANRLKHDMNFRLRSTLSGRVYSALRQQGTNKSLKTMELLSCSMDFFRQHIESQFTKGMTWDNYKRGGWSLDHIKPCASFDLTKIKEQQKCFHYSNYQPLWEFDNVHKSSFYKGKLYGQKG